MAIRHTYRLDIILLNEDLIFFFWLANSNVAETSLPQRTSLTIMQFYNHCTQRIHITFKL